MGCAVGLYDVSLAGAECSGGLREARGLDRERRPRHPRRAAPRGGAAVLAPLLRVPGAGLEREGAFTFERLRWISAPRRGHVGEVAGRADAWRPPRPGSVRAVPAGGAHRSADVGPGTRHLAVAPAGLGHGRLGRPLPAAPPRRGAGGRRRGDVGVLGAGGARGRGSGGQCGGTRLLRGCPSAAAGLRQRLPEARGAARRRRRRGRLRGERGAVRAATAEAGQPLSHRCVEPLRGSVCQARRGELRTLAIGGGVHSRRGRRKSQRSQPHGDLKRWSILRRCHLAWHPALGSCRGSARKK
mmetsp:Transcript_128869/g.412679  ORF Transcript_128869/g.412679 Transcript_128869/m.412679 type:complete len:299 (-) Transcript_128869:942-1838(-)